MKVTLKAARVNVGLTQGDVAKAAGVTKQTVCRWENGITSPPFAKLVQLAEIYKCDVGDFSMPETHA